MTQSFPKDRQFCKTNRSAGPGSHPFQKEARERRGRIETSSMAVAQPRAPLIEVTLQGGFHGSPEHPWHAARDPTWSPPHQAWPTEPTSCLHKAGPEQLERTNDPKRARETMQVAAVREGKATPAKTLGVGRCRPRPEGAERKESGEGHGRAAGIAKPVAGKRHSDHHRTIGGGGGGGGTAPHTPKHAPEGAGAAKCKARRTLVGAVQEGDGTQPPGTNSKLPADGDDRTIGQPTPHMAQAKPRTEARKHSSMFFLLGHRRTDLRLADGPNLPQPD